jgi:hypothetical protein
MDRPSVVIYEPSPIVVLDLTQAVAEVWPDAEVTVASTLAHAVTLALMTPGTVAILHTGQTPVQAIFAGSGRAASGRIVLIGDAAEADPGGYSVLSRPFSADDLRSVLTGD